MTQIYTKPELPSNFAQKLLNCQIELQLRQKIPNNIIKQIFQLYSEGLTYFESIKSYKYMYFEKKITGLYQNAKIINSLANKQQPKTQNSEKKQTNVQKDADQISMKHKQEKLKNQLVNKTYQLTNQKIKNILTENEYKLKGVKQSIQDQLTEQQQRLKLKIERRKFQNATKKAYSASDLLNSKSTKDSLFAQCQQTSTPTTRKQKIEADFSSIIKEDQDQFQDNHQEQPTSDTPEKKKPPIDADQNLLELEDN